MTKEKFSSKKFLAQLQTCPPLAYDFSKEKVGAEIKRFFLFVGYKLIEAHSLGYLTVKPDFFASREESGSSYKLAGVVRHDLSELVEGLEELNTLKKELGEEIEYFIALPPVSERHMNDFISDNNYYWYKKLYEYKYMLWLCNPDEMSVWCPFGAPSDKLLLEYFKFKDSTNVLFHLPYRSQALQEKRGVWKHELDL